MANLANINYTKQFVCTILAINYSNYSKLNCTLCDRSLIGDEYHMLFECPFFDNDRSNLIPRYYTMRPSALKFGLLMNNDNKNIQIKLSKYCKKIMSCF